MLPVPHRSELDSAVLGILTGLQCEFSYGLTPFLP